MNNEFEDVSGWPVSRYFREVVAVQPDGRVLINAGCVNLAVGTLICLSLSFWPVADYLGWGHALLFLGMPLLGFLWFLKDMPPPVLTSYEHVWRKPWKRAISVAMQLLAAGLPWFAAAAAHVR